MSAEFNEIPSTDPESPDSLVAIERIFTYISNRKAEFYCIKNEWGKDSIYDPDLHQYRRHDREFEYIIALSVLRGESTIVKRRKISAQTLEEALLFKTATIVHTLDLIDKPHFNWQNQLFTDLGAELTQSLIDGTNTLGGCK